MSSTTAASTTTVTSITNDAAGQAKLNTFLTGLTIGSNVRVNVRGDYYNHSFIISAKSSTGVTLYDCNRTGSCKIGNDAKTWA